MELQQNEFWQTQTRGTNDQEYQIYLACADDGKGGDITRNGQPLKSYEEWLSAWNTPTTHPLMAHTNPNARLTAPLPLSPSWQLSSLF